MSEQQQPESDFNEVRVDDNGPALGMDPYDSHAGIGFSADAAALGISEQELFRQRVKAAGDLVGYDGTPQKTVFERATGFVERIIKGY